METSARLSAHGGAVKIDRDALVTLPTPEGTATHVTVPHNALVGHIENRLAQHKLGIAKSEYAVQSDGNKLFGIITLIHQIQTDFSFALGIRTSNDKRIPVQMIAGTRVFVCDNMAFSGDLITLSRKHTANLDIRSELWGGVDRAVAKFGGLNNRILELKAEEIDDNRAKAMMLDAALKGIMPMRLLPDVNHHYFTPPHEEFAGRNLWSLHNAFTEGFKQLRPNIAMQSNVELGAMFNI